VFSLYLVYDLSMTRTEYAEDNRLVAASVAIYLDIISLFAPELYPLLYCASSGTLKPRARTDSMRQALRD